MHRKPLSFELDITVALDSTTNKNIGSTTTPTLSAIANAGGYIKQVLVKAPFDTATFDLRIANSNTLNILKRVGVVGELMDEVETPVPADILTVYIENASHTGSYECEIIFGEVY